MQIQKIIRGRYGSSWPIMVGPLCKLAAATHCSLVEYNVFHCPWQAKIITGTRGDLSCDGLRLFLLCQTDQGMNSEEKRPGTPSTIGKQLIPIAPFMRNCRPSFLRSPSPSSPATTTHPKEINLIAQTHSRGSCSCIGVGAVRSTTRQKKNITTITPPT